MNSFRAREENSAGIGPVTAEKLDALGIHTGLDIRSQSMTFLQENFGKAGTYYYWISRGVDDRPVRANRIRKSVGAENTFSSDLSDFDDLVAELGGGALEVIGQVPDVLIGRVG